MHWRTLELCDGQPRVQRHGWDSASRSAAVAYEVRRRPVLMPSCGTGAAILRIVASLVLIPPKILKPSRGQLRILHGMLDVAMPEEELDGPRILLIVGQLKAAAMP